MNGLCCLTLWLLKLYEVVSFHLWWSNQLVDSTSAISANPKTKSQIPRANKHVNTKPTKPRSQIEILHAATGLGPAFAQPVAVHSEAWNIGALDIGHQTFGWDTNTDIILKFIHAYMFARNTGYWNELWYIQLNYFIMIFICTGTTTILIYVFAVKLTKLHASPFP